MVIAVFSIGVLAVLKMLTYNIATADTIRLKTTASFLAKESMSLAFNLRDSNRLSSLPWDCVSNDKYTSDLDVCKDFLISGQQSTTAWMFGANADDFVDIRKLTLGTSFDEKFQQARLSMLSGTKEFPVMYYGTGFQWTPSYFARYVVFAGLTESWVLIPRDQLVKIESHVLYEKWGMTWEVVLESFIWNY